jgi:hypothetical protein
MAEIKMKKNAVEIRSELKKNGTKIEYIVIDGVKCGIMGSSSEVDRAAAIDALNKAYAASNGNMFEMMRKLREVATIEEKEIDPDEVVKVCDREIMLSYTNAKAYTMNGKEIANCEDMPALPKEAVKALLMARAEVALN